MELLVLKIGGLTVFIKDIISNQSIIKFNLINSDPEHDNIILDGMSLFTSIINDSSLKGNITINKHRTEAYGSVMFIDDPEQLFFDHDHYLGANHAANTHLERIIQPELYDPDSKKYNQQTAVTTITILNNPFFGFQKLLERGDIKMGYHKFDIKKS